MRVAGLFFFGHSGKCKNSGNAPSDKGESARICVWDKVAVPSEVMLNNLAKNSLES
jgi:hypothetical protein